MNRQVQLRLGEEVRYEPQSVILDLQADPYRLVAGTWRERQAGTLEMEVLLRGGSLSELEQQAAALRRMLAFGQAYSEAMQGRRLYVYHKTCDALAFTAEIGATWRRKVVYGGRLELPDMTLSAQGQYAVRGVLTLTVEEAWRRAAAAPAVEGASTVAPHTAYAGGLFASSAVTARRRYWDETTGLTVRYHWTAANANCTFVDVDTSWKATWNNSTQTFIMADDDSNTVETAALTLSGLVDVAFIWSPGIGMAIVVDGKEKASVNKCVLKRPDMQYTLFSPTGTQGVAQVQVWPRALTTAEAEGLYAWGRPEGELMLVRPPADLKNTNAAYQLANVPGQGPADVRLLIGGGTQDFAQVRLGLRPLRTPNTSMWECESGTLGSNTASNSNAAASGGSQARFTPADANWATRVTVELAADPANLEGLLGEHRLLLAGYDSAAAVQMNMIRWRLLLAGVAGDWSDEYAFGAVAQRSLIDLGTMSLPPGAWPAETLVANTAVTAGSFAAIEIQAKNTSGSGGGTLDLDALYLFPAEIEGTALGTLDVSAVDMALDFASDPPATTLAAEEGQLEFAGWVTYSGDHLTALPDVSSYGAGLLRVFGLRDGDESGQPNDEIDVLVFVRPTWL